MRQNCKTNRQVYDEGMTRISRALFQFAIAAGAVLVPAVAPVAQDAGGSGLVAGPHELKFKNGSGALGIVLKVEGEKFQFQPFDAAAFTMPVSRVEAVRELSEDEVIVGQGVADSRKLEFAPAMELLLPLMEKVTDSETLAPVREEIARREQENNRATSAVRDKRREAFRGKFDKLVETRQWQEALDLALADLADYPADAELLASAVMMQYRIHRSSAKSPIEFRSVQFEALRKVNPKSTVVHGIDIERETAARGQINFAKEREEYIASAMENAQKLYDAFQLKPARDVLNRALGYQPPAEVAAPMKRLLERVEAEIASDASDSKAREIERQKGMREDLKDAQTRGQVITEQQSKNFENRVQKKAGYAPRLRP